jgi:hypothetical protein
MRHTLCPAEGEKFKEMTMHNTIKYSCKRRERERDRDREK